MAEEGPPVLDTDSGASSGSYNPYQDPPSSPASLNKTDTTAKSVVTPMSTMGKYLRMVIFAIIGFYLLKFTIFR